MKNFCVVVTLILISALPAYAGKWATGTTAPATCTVGDSWTDTNGTADNRFYTCTATNTWTLNSNQTAIDTKANKAGSVMLWSEWGDGASFTTGSPPVAYNGSLYKCIAPYTKVAGETPDTQTEYFAEVTGVGGGIAHAPSDGNYYASRNGAWARLAGVFLTPTGSAAGLTFTATGFNGNLATTINTVQELADAVDDLPVGSDDQTAAEVPITDSGGYYTATTVEGALAERGADPLIHWDTATITEVENSPVAGTNTISVKAGVFQAYDANMIPWPSAISAAEVQYLNGLTEELSTSLSGKQATLVSGTNIKTVNNTSLLGSGNISISGGTGGGLTSTLSAAPYSDAACTSDGVYNHTLYKCVDDGTGTGYFTEYVATTAYSNASPVTYTLTIDGTGWNGTDLISVGGSTYTADGTKTGLSGVTSITVTPDTGRTATCSGTGITGSSSPYSADMSADRTIACTFAAESAGDVEYTVVSVGYGSTGTIASSQLWGQTWTIASGQSGTLKNVKFYTDTTITANVTCRVGTADDQLNMASSYAEGTGVLTGAAGEFAVTFASGPSLAVGSTYGIACKHDSTSNAQVRISTSNPYAGGVKYLTTAADWDLTGHQDSGDDFYFKYTVEQ